MVEMVFETILIGLLTLYLLLTGLRIILSKRARKLRQKAKLLRDIVECNETIFDIKRRDYFERFLNPNYRNIFD